MSEVEPASTTAWFAAQSDWSTRTIYSKSFSARLRRRLDNVGPGDLVVPTLLVGVEGRPNQTDQETEGGNHEPDVADQRLGDTQVRAIGANDPDIQQLASERLAGPGAAVGPEIDVIDQAED